MEVENSVTGKSNNCNDSQAVAGKDTRQQSLQKATKTKLRGAKEIVKYPFFSSFSGAKSYIRSPKSQLNLFITGGKYKNSNAVCLHILSIVTCPQVSDIHELKYQNIIKVFSVLIVNFSQYLKQKNKSKKKRHVLKR